MHYKITKQFLNEQNDKDCARFTDMNDAKLAMNELFARDYQQKTNVIYRLYDKYAEVVMQLDTSKDKPALSASASEAGSASASGASSTAGFRPSPFSITPTPGGVAKKWTTLDEDNKDKEDK